MPSLTTIAQPKYELVKMVAEILLSRIVGDQEPPANIVLPTQLIIRGSTALNSPKSKVQSPKSKAELRIEE